MRCGAGCWAPTFPTSPVRRPTGPPCPIPRMRGPGPATVSCSRWKVSSCSKRSRIFRPAAGPLGRRPQAVDLGRPDHRDPDARRLPCRSDPDNEAAVGQSVARAAGAPRPAIISPLIDALCVGGLSLLLLLPLLLSGRADLVIVGVGMQAWIAALVNMPHFMASYRLVYRNRETINAHRWAAIYVPLILIAYIAFAVWQSRETDLYVSILMTLQGGYLAWHYTGQAWGMMATYTYLDGRSFQTVERRLVRGGLYLLLAWHVAWFFRWGFGETRFGPLLESLYFILSVLSVVALVAGLVGLAMMKARTGRFPPARALIAWGAIFVWYAAMARDPRAIFWVQIAHALQYLMFR